MAKVSEEISKYNANSGGKTDTNLANDSLHLGGIPADQYATQKYVQNYHDTKEAKQKEYIDQQDQAKLQEAKSYADQIVKNQDFSSFAKVTDVKAVDKKLSDEITEQEAAQKNYTDNKVQAVVNDVNNNFNDVNNAINTLNANQSNLFQSVSNGKATVAAAITDKGISTASDASFDTMAGNIKNIQTGGSGSIDPNFVNTSDATATASDVLLGKTAYSQGSKVYGTLIAQSIEGQPTYGLDTADATALASDVVAGKTFYARGQKMTGTLHDTEIEEIYGTTVNQYSDSVIKTARANSDVEGTLQNVSFQCYSKNLDYTVYFSKYKIETTDEETGTTTNTYKYYIESYPIDQNGIYVMGSTGMTSDTVTYKKHRYTLEELEIDLSAEEIMDIKFARTPLNGDVNKCYLYILTKGLNKNETSNAYEAYLHVYTYHLTENGVIGKMYDAETNFVEHYKKVVWSSSTYSIGCGGVVPYNLDSNKVTIIMRNSTRNQFNNIFIL